MKKFFTLLTVALVASIGFSSCTDHDEEEAIMLSGEWEGDWGMWYQDEDGYVFDADYTYIQLIPDHTYATYGIGYQEDYYSWDETGRVRSYYDYLWYKFDWEIRNGILYLTYHHDPDLDTYIRDYRLTNDWFTGYFGKSNTRFRMSKLSDYYRWTPSIYVDAYFGYTVYAYLSKPFEGAAKARSFDKAPAIVKRGSHMR